MSLEMDMFSGWEMAFGIGALALGLTLAYGVYHTRNVGRQIDGAGERGAKEIYDHPAESDASPDGRRRGAATLVWIMAALLAVWLVVVFTYGDRRLGNDHPARDAPAAELPNP